MASCDNYTEATGLCILALGGSIRRKFVCGLYVLFVGPSKQLVGCCVKQYVGLDGPLVRSIVWSQLKSNPTDCPIKVELMFVVPPAQKLTLEAQCYHR